VFIIILSLSTELELVNDVVDESEQEAEASEDSNSERFAGNSYPDEDEFSDQEGMEFGDSDDSDSQDDDGYGDDDDDDADDERDDYF
jgi:hypothetical protein